MPETMQYNIGSIRAHILSDGYREQELDPAQNFPDVTMGEFKRAMEAYDVDIENTRMERNCLLLEAHGKHILVDAGLGPKWDGELIENMAEVGVTPDQIDHVIFTHGHGDHIAGIMGEKGELVYPNAQFWMWFTEWEFWSNPDRYGEGREFAANHPTGKAVRLISDKLTTLDEEAEFMPGITAVKAPGHTMGHMGLLISDGDEKLLVMGDVFLYDFQLEHIDWCTPFDRYPEIMIKSRRKLIELSEREDTPLMAYHFAFPGIGRAVRDGANWKWEALF